MIILALDPATRKVGWALGEAGALPRVGVLKLDEDRAEAATERFARWLNHRLFEDGVTLLAVEHFLPHGAKLGKTTDATKEALIGLSYAARAVAAVNGVAFRSPMPSTIRKHFLGRVSMGSREETKAAIVRRAQLLNYLAKDNFSDDAADAAALWDFSVSHWGRKAAQFALT